MSPSRARRIPQVASVGWEMPLLRRKPAVDSSRHTEREGPRISCEALRALSHLLTFSGSTGRVAIFGVSGPNRGQLVGLLVGWAYSNHAECLAGSGFLMLKSGRKGG